MPDTDTNTASPTSAALAYLKAATAIGQALAMDAATIAGGVGNQKLAEHITGALGTFGTLQAPVQDFEQLAVGLFGFFGHLAHAHAATKQAGG